MEKDKFNKIFETIEDIKIQSKEEGLKHYKSIVKNKKMDFDKLKSIIISISDHVLNPSNEEIEYLIKYYSEGTEFLLINQFIDLIEAILIDKHLSNKI